MGRAILLSCCETWPSIRVACSGCAITEVKPLKSGAWINRQKRAPKYTPGPWGRLRFINRRCGKMPQRRGVCKAMLFAIICHCVQTNIIPRNSMANKLPLTLAAPTQHLRHLVMIRWLLVICLGLTAALTLTFSDLTLPYRAFATILLIFISLNWLTALRLHREVPVTDIEFFIQ